MEDSSLARKAPAKKYYRLDLEVVDEWDVKTFVASDMVADLLITDAGYLIISEPALKALQDAGASIPQEHPVKIVRRADF